MANGEVKGRYPLLEPKVKYAQCFCTEEDIALAEAVREFVDREVMPRRTDLEGGFHRDEKLALDTLYGIYRKAAELGVTKMSVPESAGGIGASAAARMMVLEELSRGDIGLANMVAKMAWITSIMGAARRKDLLQEFNPKILADPPWAACVAMSEPGGGANIEDPALAFRTLKTIASEDGDAWVLNGHKIWPGPAGAPERFQHQDLAGHMGYWVLATTDPGQGPNGVGIFYVPGDVPGLSFSAPIEKMGMSFTDENVEIWLDNVRVPKRYRIDTEPGQAADIVVGNVLGFGRLSGAPCLTGLSQAVLETVLDWTARRQIGGVPVRERSAFAMIIAEMFRAIDISRNYYMSLTYQVTRRDLYGKPSSKEMMAKYSAARSYAADVAEMVCNRGMELMGSYGYAFGNQVEKYMRDYKIVQLWLGGPQRDRLDVAQGLYGHFNWPGTNV